MRKKLITLALFVTLALTACGSKPSTVEEYYKEPATAATLDEELESTMSAYSDVYSKIAWDAVGNTFEYHYTYADEIDTEILAELVPEFSASLGEQSDSLIEALEEETGIDGVSIRFVYYNPDGTVIFDETFSK